MAVCTECHQEMLTADGCTAETYDDWPDSIPTKRIPYGSAMTFPPVDRCHDCGAKPWFLHHPGCDVELCPRCLGQAISCGCAQTKEE